MNKNVPPLNCDILINPQEVTLAKKVINRINEDVIDIIINLYELINDVGHHK